MSLPLLVEHGGRWRRLLERGEGADVEFESLVVLALDLKFGLKFLDEQFEA